MYNMKKYLESQKREIEKMIEEEEKITPDRAYLHFLKGRLFEVDHTLMTLFLYLQPRKDEN